MFNALGFENYVSQISLRDPKNKTKYIKTLMRIGTRQRLQLLKLCRKRLRNSGRIWGSYILWTETRLHGQRRTGKRVQLGTIQVDYNLPERFELEYTGADNQSIDL